MRHLNKVLNLLEKAAEGVRGEDDVLKCMHPGVPNVTADDIRLAREELISIEAHATGTTVTSVDGKPSGIFVHPEVLHLTGDNGLGVLGDRVMRELEYHSRPLLAATTGNK